MGHDVCGFKNKDGEHEIAYLRRGAWNKQARDIYKALGATEHDCGCSGGGEIVFFTRERLKMALERLPAAESHNEERKFINDLLDNGPENGAWIGFY